ncbi:hypothetical protein G20c_98 [Thermus phage G20c]|nr:hypothetical protein G20c_98 [Thermus phage G20c]
MRRALAKLMRKAQKRKDLKASIGMQVEIGAIEVVRSDGSVEVLYRRDE